MPGREHIVALPTSFFILCIVQIVISVIVLALSAYLTHYITWTSTSLAIFTCIYTWILCAYYLTSTLAVTSIYNLWAVLALQIGAVLFWLCSMATLASDAAYWWTGRYGATTNPTVNSGNYSDSPSIESYRGVFAADAGMAGLMFVLFIITLVLFSIQMNRHRSSGAPAMAGGAFNDKSQAPQAYPQQQPAPAPQQPIYSNQQVPQQQPYPPAQQPYPTTQSPPPQQLYPQPAQSPPPQHGYQQAPYEVSNTPAPYQPSVSPVSSGGYQQQQVYHQP